MIMQQIHASDIALFTNTNPTLFQNVNFVDAN